MNSAEDGKDPIGYLFYPIFEEVDNPKSKVVGNLVMFLHWRRLFSDISPSSAKGIVAVFENSCEQSFTYKIDGKDVQYMGPGDLHDPNYGDMVESVALTEFFNSLDSQFYSGVKLSEENCQYSLRVYPSTDTEVVYISKYPVFYTMASVFIFVFTSIVFFAYDLFVEHRQRVVLRKALQSGALVSSLFPAAIADRLVE
jgi:hypothetical protein